MLTPLQSTHSSSISVLSRTQLASSQLLEEEKEKKKVGKLCVAEPGLATRVAPTQVNTPTRSRGNNCFVLLLLSRCEEFSYF